MTISAPRFTLQGKLYNRCACRGRRHVSSRLLASLPTLSLVLAFASTVFAEDRPESFDPWPSHPSASKEEVVREFDLWPFVVIERTPSWRQSAIRPFYYERGTTDGTEKKVQFLWPIYLYRRSDKDVTVRVFPLYTYWKDVYEYEGGREHDVNYMLLPFLYGGTSTEEGKYFALFPVGGNLKNFLGRDEIHFFLFPLYMEYSKDELHQRNYLWPVLSISRGGEYQGFRLWPLFGYFEKLNEYRNEFLLWPIFHHQTFDLDEEQSGERLLILPLYAREDSRMRRYRSVLWPFFTHEQNYAKNYEEYSAPWPFLVMTRGDAIHRTQLWPLYGYTRTKDREERFLLWPFWYRRVFTLDEDSKRYETLLVPLLSSKTEVSESRGVVNHKVRFWPLFRFRRFEDGSTYLRMLSLLWFDDEQGFERHYSPLWTIYERGTTPDGGGHTYALWRLFRHRHTRTGSDTRIPLLYSHMKDTEEGSEEKKILGGILGSSRKGEERRFRILFFINIPY